MSNNSRQPCVVRSCDQSAHNSSPYSGFALCEQHLGSDLKRLELREAVLLNKLDSVANSAQKKTLRLEQQALQVEIQEIEDMFEFVQERLQLWKKQLISNVQLVHSAYSDRLKDVADAERCLSEVRSARSDRKFRNLMKLIVSLEIFADEAVERSAEFESLLLKLRRRSRRRDEDIDEEEDDEPSEFVYRCIGDLSSGVSELQLLIDKHMDSLMRQCQSDLSSNDKPVCPPLIQTMSLAGEPRYLALCTNANKYASDPNDRIVSLDSITDRSARKLSVPLIFVALRPSSSYLLGVSFDSRRKVKLLCGKLDWNKAINGLHCDNVRQQVFLAQDHAVTVTDLSGQVIIVVSIGSLNLPAGKISSMSCSGDKVFLLVQGTSQLIHSFSKTSGKLESSLNVSAYGEGNIRKLCLQESKIWLADWKKSKVLKICGITGQLISSLDGFFVRSNLDIMPLHLVTDDFGRLYVSELKSHCVQLFLSGSDEPELFGSRGSAGAGVEVFNRPADMLVYNSKAFGYKILVVADTNNHRLAAFQLI